MLDYDGTLAPFHAEKMKAFPYPGVAERLECIASLPNNRLVLISGRPVHELPLLLPVASRIEVWGSHGRERKTPDGSYFLYQLSIAQESALASMKTELQQAGYSQSLEWKPTSLAVHWRSLAPVVQRHLADLAANAFKRYATGLNLEPMPFQCGVEYRALSRNKGSVVEELFAGSSNRSSVFAYLGDDKTDEDAFIALKKKGSSWLVHSECRESSADFWLTPPEELLQFLDRWIQSKSCLSIGSTDS